MTEPHESTELPGDDSRAGVRRRELLRGIAAAPIAGLAVPAVATVAAADAEAAGGARWPTAPLTTAQADVVDPAQFLPAGQFARWYGELDAVGLRAAGDAAHERWIDRWAHRLRAVGLRDVHDEPVTFDRWTTRDHDLFVEDGAGRRRVPTAWYIPFSGATPTRGVTGPLVVVDPAMPPAPDSLRGKVALFDVPTAPVRYGDFDQYLIGEYDPRGVLGDDEIYDRPWAGIDALKELLDALVAAGAVAAIGVVGLPPEGARGAYFPYDGEVRPVPGVFVDAPTGARLRQALAEGPLTVRVVVPGRTARVTSRNVVGVLPGASDEIVLLNSHTDGSNGLEDNGPDAIVAMIQYLARLPRAARPRTVMVSLTTGHFAGGIGQRTFVAEHRARTFPRTACALSIEHLGAREWLPRSDGRRMELTGRFEVGTIFTPRNRAMLAAAQRIFAQADADPGKILRPYVPKDTSPDGFGWPGEGTQLWDEGGVMTANYITGPTYLLNVRPTLRLFDAERARALAIAFTQAVLDLSRVPAATLRAPDF